MSPTPAPPSDLFRATPEVVLFVGGAVVSVALIIVMMWFWVRISRQERNAERERRGGGA